MTKKIKAKAPIEKKMCQREGCDHEAVAAVKIHIPVIGVALSAQIPLTSILNLPLCNAHFPEFDVQEFMALDDGRYKKMVTMLCVKGKRQMPDFDAAFTSMCFLKSPEYINAIGKKQGDKNDR